MVSLLVVLAVKAEERCHSLKGAGRGPAGGGHEECGTANGDRKCNGRGATT